jgi:hypothetical protein
MIHGVSGTTSIPTEFGPLTIGQIATLQPTDTNNFSDYIGPKIFLENGYLTTPRLFLIIKPENLVEISLANGTTVKARKNQRVLTKKGWIPFFRLNPGDYAATIGKAFTFLCSSPNTSKPAYSLTLHPEYAPPSMEWTLITSYKVQNVIEPAFSLSVPYYMRFIGNGVILKD